MALTAGQIPIYANVPNGGQGTLAASSNTVTLGVDTNGVNLYTAGSKGGRVMSLNITTNDTAIVNVMLWILNGATVRPLGVVNIPASSGNLQNILDVNGLDPSVLKGLPRDQFGNPYIPLQNGEVLRAGALANLTAAKSCYIVATGMDYQA